MAAAPEPGHAAAVRSINAFGIDLHRALVAGGARSNLLASPFSIVGSLAMTHAGAEGPTLAEVSRVLHLPGPQRAAQESFRHLGMVMRSAAPTNGPAALRVAQRLFGSRAASFDKGFLNLMVMVHRSPLERLDFSRPVPAAQRINDWVASETMGRIQNLVPASAISSDTRLVLVNALHFKAPWRQPFAPGSARPEPFHLAPGSRIDVPTLSRRARCGLRQHPGFKAVAIPYEGGRFQFVMLVPDAIDGLGRVESALTPELVASLASLPGVEVEVHLPKVRIEPPAIRLAPALRAMGLKTAFNDPPGSANFRRMVPPAAPSPWISDVFHKAFLQLDESGTEAAAATATLMVATSAPAPGATPPVIRADRPFLFLVTERESGVVLFLGRVVRP